MLHGDIKVNHHIICSWRAVRIEGSDKADSLNNYKVDLAYTDWRGYHKVADFELQHRYGDGALALASRILSRAEWHLRAPVDVEEFERAKTS